MVSPINIFITIISSKANLIKTIATFALQKKNNQKKLPQTNGPTTLMISRSMVESVRSQTFSECLHILAANFATNMSFLLVNRKG